MHQQSNADKDKYSLPDFHGAEEISNRAGTQANHTNERTVKAADHSADARVNKQERRIIAEHKRNKESSDRNLQPLKSRPHIGRLCYRCRRIGRQRNRRCDLCNNAKVKNKEMCANQRHSELDKGRCCNCRKYNVLCRGGESHTKNDRGDHRKEQREEKASAGCRQYQI